MRKYLTTLFLLTVTLPALAQTPSLQQLQQQLSNHPQQDTFYVNRITDFAFQSFGGNIILPRQEDSLASVALAVAQKLNYTQGIMVSTFYVATAKFDLGDYPQSIHWAQQADSLAEKNGNPEWQVRALMSIGNVKLFSSPSEGLNDILKAEAIAETLPDKLSLARCQLFIGSIYTGTFDNYPKAIEWTLKAIQTYEQLNNLRGLEQAWSNMGLAYDGLGDYETALTYYTKAQQAADSFGIKDAYLQNSIGEDYRLSGKYPQAIAAYQKALAIDKTLDNIAVDQSNMADVYVKVNDLPNAFRYAFTALSGFKKLNHLSGVTWIDNILARAYLAKNMVDSALYYANDGLRLAQQVNDLELLRDNTQTLSDIYAQKKDFEKAYNYHLQYITYRDSMNNAQISSRAGLLQYNYNKEKTNAQIAALNADKKNQRNMLIIALGVLGLIVIGSALLMRNIRQKQKANKLLQQSYSNVELLEEIGRKITSSLSVQGIIGTVYTNVNALMDANVFGIGIYNDALKRIEFPSTYEKGEVLSAYANAIDDENRFAPICFNSGKEIIMGNLEEEYKDHVQQIQTPDEGGQPHSLIFLPLIAKEKKLGVLTVQSFQKNAYTDYHVYMLRNIAIYTAIALDNASAYQELKSTQAQLIQSEKMASLGELTAGIAHEIQNPLNFVNNFSEINKELIEEIQSTRSKMNGERYEQLQDELLLNIKDNEEKIIHHGRRADAIVKGMLQHSRKDTGTKEPTDINSLADEYLRLCYHGIRAKDKAFNATMKTDFDNSIGKINIVPQDIGRVLLNLYNNAFYAVSEKKNASTSLPTGQAGSAGQPYEPTVSISTKKINNKIEIRVSDNGNGIPQKVLDKIFQPFFTTKPTGQGTGLGLSLSYDIITKGHGGEIKVNTKENEGSEFIIQLPNPVA